MRDEDSASAAALDDAWASLLGDAEAVADPVGRVLALCAVADRAAAAVRDVDAATGRAVHRALETMDLDELSTRLRRSAGDVLFLASSFLTPPSRTDQQGPEPEEPDTSAPST